MFLILLGLREKSRKKMPYLASGFSLVTISGLWKIVADDLLIPLRLWFRAQFSAERKHRRAAIVSASRRVRDVRMSRSLLLCPRDCCANPRNGSA